MLPQLRDESKRVLRRVELEAYSALVSAFRAQGDLSKEKKKMLQELQSVLSISTERHRAEVRRAVNDEELATIAENMTGSTSTAEWLIEGRRLVPLMPRLVPQTAFTVTANQAASLMAEKNTMLPSPSQAAALNREVPVPPPPASVTQSTNTTITRVSRPSSPTSNVVVLPSGMSIHIKGGLNTEDDDDIQVRKRRRSTSTDSLVSPTALVPQVTYTTTVANTTSVSPMKITISKSPSSQPKLVTSGSQTQKVILVSSAGTSSTGVMRSLSSPNVVQKSVTMPVVKTTSSTGIQTANQNKSIIIPSTTIATNGSVSNVVTVASPSTTPVTTTSVSTLTSVVGTSTTGFLTPTISISKPRPKTIPRQKIIQVPQHKPGVVIPMGPQPVQPSPQNIQGIQIKPVTKQTPTIQIRQEGGMKIITQNVPGSSKILPKPTQLTTPSGTPVVVVSAGSSSIGTSSVTMVNRPISTLSAGHGTKILNIQTQGGKIISASKGSSVVHVNPKTLHLTAVKGAAGSKPNVIVVQKTQPKRSQTPTTPPSAAGSKTTVLSSPFEKELVSFLQKQDPSKQYVVTTTTANVASRPVERKVIVTTPGQGDTVRQVTHTVQRPKSDKDNRTSSLLHDLIQAAGILPDGTVEGAGGEVTLNLDESQVAALSAAHTETITQPKSAPTQTLPSNEWFEYDVTDEHGNTYTHTAESADTAAAIQSLLDMQANGAQQKPKVTVQRSASIDIGQLSDQLNQQQFYTIEQAMTILNQSEKETATSASGVSLLPSVDSSSQLSQSSISTSDLSEASTSSLPATHTRVSIGSGLGPELLHGELDPQTGLFLNNSGQPGSIVTTQTSVPQINVNKNATQVVEVGSAIKSNFDLLSSSIAQAQLDLDPYQFIEDPQVGNRLQADGERTITVSVADSNTMSRTTGAISLLNPPPAASDSAISSQPAEVIHDVLEQPETEVVSSAVTTEEIVTEIPSDGLTVEGEVTPGSTLVLHKVEGQSATPASIRIQPSSFIPLQDAAKTSKTSKINITTHKNQPATSVVSVIPSAITAAPDANIHVTVEPSGLDTSHMKIEDFTSQQISNQTDFVGIDHMEEINTAPSTPPSSSSGLSDSQGENNPYFESDQVKLLKRKRKSQSTEESASPPGIVGGWTRAAQGVLLRVSRYRGVNRDKSELNAAAWFVQPVDPADAPDYYDIVKDPMDFGTIKRKLDTGKYLEFEDFHADMMLVRDNCYLYNPVGSVVRKDCDEVFNFYAQEHDRLLEKWQKTHIASPIAKKQRMDRSPIRS